MEESEFNESMLFSKVESLLENKGKVVIAVSGTPGVGKTTVSKKIAEKFNLHYFDLNEYAKSNGYSLEFNEKQDTYVIDTEKLFEKVEINLKSYKEKATLEADFDVFSKYKGVILDSHFAHDLLNDYVDLCIIVKADLKELRKRLESRNYSKEKVEENIDCEIFEICLTEAIENNQKVVVLKN